MNDPQVYRTVDAFDRAMGALANLPDTTKSKPTTITAVNSLTGDMQTFIIQTFRQRDVGDTIGLQYVDAAGSKRISIPPAVADAIARQRDALTTKVRKRVGRDSAAARKARGEQPAFLRVKKDIA